VRFLGCKNNDINGIKGAGSQGGYDRPGLQETGDSHVVSTNDNQSMSVQDTGISSELSFLLISRQQGKTGQGYTAI
jgi:hypothetical protein